MSGLERDQMKFPANLSLRNLCINNLISFNTAEDTNIQGQFDTQKRGELQEYLNSTSYNNDI
tara:strand:+ start:215 stop:400 length:186 start_codon:yes stop_codon:yes gene_type:complete